MPPSPQPPAIRGVPTRLIMGSAGERRARIAELIATRPAGERWALLVAASPLAAAVADFGAGIVARSAPLGCFGCMPEVPLRVAITRLLRESRPARLLLEIEFAAERARAIDLVRSFGATLRLEQDTDDDPPGGSAIR